MYLLLQDHKYTKQAANKIKKKKKHFRFWGSLP